MPDTDCICQGNWRTLIAESAPLFGKKFVDINGLEYTFYGLVHSSEDYYFGMCDNEGRSYLLSCVGTLEQHGYRLA